MPLPPDGEVPPGLRLRYAKDSSADAARTAYQQKGNLFHRVRRGSGLPYSEGTILVPLSRCQTKEAESARPSEVRGTIHADVARAPVDVRASRRRTCAHGFLQCSAGGMGTCECRKGTLIIVGLGHSGSRFNVQTSQEAQDGVGQIAA